MLKLLFIVMNKEAKSPSWQSWSIAIGGIATVFAVLVLALALQSRHEIRQQILDRDAHVLAGVAKMLQLAEDDFFLTDDLAIAFQTSKLRGVLAVRLFDANGDFVLTVPPEIAAAEIADPDWPLLRRDQPVAHFHPKADLQAILGSDPETGNKPIAPVQEILVPLHDPELAEITAVIQYILDGRPVQNEFDALDHTLLRQAGMAFGVGLLALVALAALAFSRLTRSHQALEKQTVRLRQANRELSLAARTSAIGAVTSHLIHGIRNPLTGLDLFFQTRNTDELPGQSPESWRQLADATNQIRILVDDVVEVLREEDSTTSFELTLEELEAVLHEKLHPKATAAGIRFETRRNGEASLAGHAANIILLVLINLFENALSLTPKDKLIWVSLERKDSDIVFEVGDEGPGIPAHIQPHLFTPGKSGRPGGTGLGLAISHRLATNLKATLTLKSSDESGTVFSLRYPLETEEAEEEESMSRRSGEASGLERR